MTICLTKGSGSASYRHYSQWLTTVDSSINIVDLHTMDVEESLRQLEKSSGVVFTGGPDVHPERHGNGHRLDVCTVDEERDEREFLYFDRSQELALPILAVCRGLQLSNVALGGTLYCDIPSDVATTQEHRKIQDEDANHDLETEPGSLLKKITGHDIGVVNSAHHQGIEVLSPVLRKAGTSGDGIIEAVEWSDRNGKGFFLGVQWHPERMNFQSPFSLPLARHFLYEAEGYEILVKGKQYIIKSDEI